ncbi:hypothetical protein GCM10010272_55970 [Streptomyces lateritius]|nr:hypothetical protein GCM10010272_55970 [Streptomyces lateritius]
MGPRRDRLLPGQDDGERAPAGSADHHTLDRRHGYPPEFPPRLEQQLPRAQPGALPESSVKYERGSGP